MKTIIHWRSGDLLVENSTYELEDKLTYRHKSLELNEEKFKREVKTQRANLFKVVTESPRMVIVYQGLIDRVVAGCRDLGLDWEVLDKRMKMPPMQLKLARGFRLRQFPLFLEMLSKGRSGILEAPTRYGKTIMIINTLRVWPGVKTAVMAPGDDLLRQLMLDLKEALPGRDVSGIFSGCGKKRESDDITVVSMDSLDRLDYDSFRLVLVDEPHACSTATRDLTMSKFQNARIYGFGATPFGRFDGADKVTEGLIGPVLARRTFQEAKQEGAICQIVVYMLRMPFDAFVVKDRRQAYNQLVYYGPDLVTNVANIGDHIIPKNWQTIIFVAEAKQAETLTKAMAYDCDIAVAGQMTGKERKKRFEEMKAGTILRCAATSIYATGLTFPDIRCVINVAGGGGSITGTQKPGRLAQCRPGKKAGYLVDFLFQCRQAPSEDKDEPNEIGLSNHIGGGTGGGSSEWRAVVRDCESRLKVYQKLGYDVRIIDSTEQIKLE